MCLFCVFFHNFDCYWRSSRFMWDLHIFFSVSFVVVSFVLLVSFPFALFFCSFFLCLFVLWCRKILGGGRLRVLRTLKPRKFLSFKNAPHIPYPTSKRLYVISSLFLVRVFRFDCFVGWCFEKRSAHPISDVKQIVCRFVCVRYCCVSFVFESFLYVIVWLPISMSRYLLCFFPFVFSFYFFQKKNRWKTRKSKMRLLSISKRKRTNKTKILGSWLLNQNRKWSRRFKPCLLVGENCSNRNWKYIPCHLKFRKKTKMWSNNKQASVLNREISPSGPLKAFGCVKSNDSFRFCFVH